MARKNPVGKSIKETYDYKNQRVGNHYNFVSQAVDDFAYKRTCKGTADCTYGKQKANGAGSCSVKKNQNVGAKGKENLLARPIENFKTCYKKSTDYF